MKSATLGLFAFLLLAGCSAPSGIGGPCTVTADCEYGQVCNSTGAGGFCTRGCTFNGSQGECPSGATCTTVGSGIGTTQLLCVSLCSGGGCRDGYECVAAGGSTITACKPKPVQ